MIKSTDTTDPAAAGADPAGPQPEGIADLRADDVSEQQADDAVEAHDEDEPTDPPVEEERAEGKVPSQRRSISIGVRSLVLAALIAVLVGAVATLGWLYVGALGKLDAQANESAANAHAEKVALDYAVNAAEMDYNNLQAWKVKLVAGTSQELNDKLSEAAKSMEQLLVPLEWSSTAEPLVAKVRSNTGGVFLVDCFVKVQTKTVQAPDALQSTATYSVTIDSNKNWLITEVGGIGSVPGPR